ncbi:hypothetical protein [Duganella violaceipulchra]|uniref:Uncharacterized protein n=1 Tax=Duganella violaceipulchra TaxID=2849652 RepID=A0AA41L075_9BURK|nr:hypothetical protein [Duganella violaceicalia]MBV6322151.1 hypothetical protein [Duganella violaceicalia]MCP2011297.1 hypothetical protein [Duganella violaceicalia]
MEQEDFSVPDDFPRPVHMGAASGLQDKLLLVKYGSKFYTPGCTPPELRRRWDVCEDLSRQFSEKCRETKGGKRAHMSEVEILEQYLQRSLRMGWGSSEEMQWVSRRTSAILGWPVAIRSSE